MGEIDIMRSFGGCIVFLVLLGTQGYAESRLTIVDLFSQFDALTVAMSGNPAEQDPVEPLIQTSCTLSFAQTRAAVDVLERRQSDIEKMAAKLDLDYRELIGKMPRIGAAENACSPRIQRDIQSFKERIDALELTSLKDESESLVNCVISLREKNVAETQRLSSVEVADLITGKLLLNKSRKAVTDLQAERTAAAVFFEQAESLLLRRLYEMKQSEQINCNEGDEF